MDDCHVSLNGRHQWERDPVDQSEGLICAACGVTEAELYGDRDE